MATNAVPRPARQEQLQLLVLGIAVAVAATVVGWLLLHDRSDGGGRTGPVLMMRTELESFARASSNPIYWAGPRSGYAYEVTRTPSSWVFVRYLPKGVPAGDKAASFVAVGTYPDPHAFASLERAAERPDTNSVRLPHGGLAVVYKRSPTSVYVGRRGQSVQVEVYDPLAANARALVLSGAIVPVR